MAETVRGHAAGGAEYAAEQLQRVQQRLAELPTRLQALKKSGQPQLPRTDPEARVLRKHGRSIVGYTAELAVSEDHFIVAQRVTQQKTDNDALLPMLAEVERQSGRGRIPCWPMPAITATPTCGN